jgi:hypothetical protein
MEEISGEYLSFNGTHLSKPDFMGCSISRTYSGVSEFLSDACDGNADFVRN